MAKLVVGSFGFDMNSWDLSDIASGTVTSDSSTEVDVSGAGAFYAYTITGTGFTTFDTNGFPTDGTVTGVTMAHPGHTPLVISNISISATDFMGFVNGNDPTGLEAVIFSGDDSFTGRAGDDTLVGYNGNDNFNLSKGGNDTADGGAGNDLFAFAGAFTAADTVDGGTGTDKVVLGGDYSAGVTFGATTMVNVENMVLTNGHSYKLTLNAATVTSGHQLVIDGRTMAAANTMNIDGSAVSGNLRLLGGKGHDTLTGGSGDDLLQSGNTSSTLDISAGGTDAVRGGTAGDTILAGAALTAADHISGGGGTDTLVLDGDYSGGLVLADSHIKGVSTVQLNAGHDYVLSTDADEVLGTIDGSRLGAGDTLNFDGSATTATLPNRGFVMVGGAGDDVLRGKSGAGIDGVTGNVFDLSKGGSDTATGGGTFIMGGALDASDRLTGTGASVVHVDGDYSTTVVFDDDTFTNMNRFGVDNPASTNTYSFVEADGNVAAGGLLAVDAAGTSFTFDGSAETDGRFIFDINGAQGTLVHFIGGAGNDNFTINMVQYNSADVFNGGTGNDAVSFDNQNHTASTTVLGGGMLVNIDTIDLHNGAIIKTVDGNVGAGQTLNVGIDYTQSAHRSVFNGANETDGHFNIHGAGTVFGGQLGDTISLNSGSMRGNGGADTLTSTSSGSNHVDFDYAAASDSTGANYDTLVTFRLANDFISGTSTTGVDTQVTTGALSTASFDTDLAAAIGAGQLAANHAVVFTPDSGTLSGDHFLVIDFNGVAGYQAGQDLVMLLNGTVGGLGFTTANFI